MHFTLSRNTVPIANLRNIYSQSQNSISWTEMPKNADVRPSFIIIIAFPVPALLDVSLVIEQKDVGNEIYSRPSTYCGFNQDSLLQILPAIGPQICSVVESESSSSGQLQSPNSSFSSSGSRSESSESIDTSHDRLWNLGEILPDYSYAHQKWIATFADFSEQSKVYDKKLHDTSHEIQDIVQDLCERSPRFRFISEALNYFITEDLQQNLQLLTEDELRGIWLAECIKRDSTENPWTHAKLERSIGEIIMSTIYELLNVFDIRISQDQIPNVYRPSQCLDILRQLHGKSKEIPLPSGSKVESRLADLDSAVEEECIVGYQYSDKLDSTLAQVRILHLLPGSGDDPIVCRLETRDLYEEGIDEALSYVWGQGDKNMAILLNDKHFPLTEHLYGILHTLRYPDIDRHIWVDAICINQSVAEEKAHQVRLMRDIYSNARNTIVWLEGNTVLDEPSQDLLRFSSKSEEALIDRHNLVVLLKRFQEAMKDGSQRETRAPLYLRLRQCVVTISRQEWWERMWTLQEAVLPPHPPTMFFKGFWFSLDDFLNACLALSPKVTKISDVIDGLDESKYPLPSCIHRQTSSVPYCDIPRGILFFLCFSQDPSGKKTDTKYLTS